MKDAEDPLTMVRNACAKLSLVDLRAAIEAHRSTCRQPNCPVIVVMEEHVKDHFMTIRCPKCKTDLEVMRTATVIPPHCKPQRAGLLDNEVMKINGEDVVITLLKLCRLSGAEFKRLA